VILIFRFDDMSMMRKHYFRTKDLATIAALACLGAITSTYLGYMGRMLGAATGIPYASQILTGLHSFWLILMLALVNKKGSALLGAALNNTVQFLMGSHLGIWVLPVGILQGLLAEIAYWPLRRLSAPLAMVLAGGLSSISHIVIMQMVFRLFGPAVIVGSFGAVAFASGAFWAGIFPFITVKLLRRAGIVGAHPTPQAAGEPQYHR
jgi:energy-coupling factor transport system substrate-specific component